MKLVDISEYALPQRIKNLMDKGLKDFYNFMLTNYTKRKALLP